MNAFLFTQGPAQWPNKNPLMDLTEATTSQAPDQKTVNYRADSTTAVILALELINHATVASPISYKLWKNKFQSVRTSLQRWVLVHRYQNNAAWITKNQAKVTPPKNQENFNDWYHRNKDLWIIWQRIKIIIHITKKKTKRIIQIIILNSMSYKRRKAVKLNQE